MPSLAEAREANSKVEIPFAPVALFVGGTSGIGQASAESFARYTKGNAHIIICGRNEAAAKSIIASLPRHPASKYEFLECDASKMANVTAACKSLRERHGVSKLNYLFLSPGFFSYMGSYKDNGEGVDSKFALHFYSRFKFFTELAPQLQAATNAGEEARVVTVLGAGYGGPVDLQDLGLKKSYSVFKCGRQSPTYSSLVVEELAKRNPTMSFTHISPGAVDTPIKNGTVLTKWLIPLMSSFLTTPMDCSEWMLRPLLDPTMSRGAFHLDNHANRCAPDRLYLTPEAQKAVFDHFMEVSSKF